MRQFLFLLYLCLPLVGLSQKATERYPFTSHNTIYVEGLGSGGLYSINYERFLLLKEKQAYGFRVGTSFYGIQSAIAAIGELFALIGKGKHHLDVGIGLTTLSDRSQDFGIPNSSIRYMTFYAVPRIAYRYQKPTGGLMARVGFTPFGRLGNRPDSTKFSFGPWLGLAIGYSF